MGGNHVLGLLKAIVLVAMTGLARYISAIYIEYISNIFEFENIGYFPYFFNITLLLDVKTSLKCENRHFKFSVLLIM